MNISQKVHTTTHKVNAQHCNKKHAGGKLAARYFQNHMMDMMETKIPKNSRKETSKHLNWHWCWQQVGHFLTVLENAGKGSKEVVFGTSFRVAGGRRRRGWTMMKQTPLLSGCGELQHHIKHRSVWTIQITVPGKSFRSTHLICWCLLLLFIQSAAT